MKKLFALVLIAVSSSAMGMGGADPFLYKLTLDKLEARKASDGFPLLMDGDLWLGKDYNKLWIKGELEYAESTVEEAEIQFLYSRAISAFWDIQIGWRGDFEPVAKDWFAVSLYGVAPLMFESDISLFVDTDARVNLRVDTEYEIMLTRRMALVPELEANVYSKSGGETGGGLSDANLGLRLRYELLREFAPYIGVNASLLFGGTADHAVAHGHSRRDLQMLVGVRTWF
ncbi:MAG: copper resistance protein B [Gammaproteobacteria bacterium]|nr:copper resistance protein B [Gammaproteobacteria bacterium]